MTVHFVRVGKTASTALKTALSVAIDEGMPTTYGPIVTHAHGTRMADLPPGDVCFFALRDPVTRFVSGFQSRLRQGKPRYDLPWKPGEEAAFARFGTPQELAHGLVSDSAQERADARHAFRTINHVRTQYTYWTQGLPTLRKRLDRVVYILRQETFDQDLLQLAEVLGLPRDVLRIDQDPVTAHITPPEQKQGTSLDDRAVAALRAWYAPSYAVLDWCEEVRRERGWGQPGGVPAEGPAVVWPGEGRGGGKRRKGKGKGKGGAKGKRAGKGAGGRGGRRTPGGQAAVEQEPTETG